MRKYLASLELKPPGVKQENRTVVIGKGRASVPIRANASGGASSSASGGTKPQRWNVFSEVKVSFKVALPGELHFLGFCVCVNLYSLGNVMVMLAANMFEYPSQLASQKGVIFVGQEGN